jgi:hypothetical protein
VSGVDPVVTPLAITSVTGWSTFLISAPLAGETGDGATNVTPVAALVIDCGVVADASFAAVLTDAADPPSTVDGRAGLCEHAGATTRRARALHTETDFGFMSSC